MYWNYLEYEFPFLITYLLKNSVPVTELISQVNSWRGSRGEKGGVFNGNRDDVRVIKNCLGFYNPASIYLFKVNNWRQSVFLLNILFLLNNFEHIWHLFLVFLLLIMNK